MQWCARVGYDDETSRYAESEDVEIAWQCGQGRVPSYGVSAYRQLTRHRPILLQTAKSDRRFWACVSEPKPGQENLS